MKKRTYKGEIATEYCKNYPNASTMAIARMLCNDHPLDFPKFESARSIVRSCRGELLDKKKRVATVAPRSEETKKKFISRKMNLPESDYKEIEPYVLAKGSNSILFLSDIHLPYQDNKALSIALDYGKAQKVNAIYLNGDTMDMYMASRFIRDRRLRDLAGELDIARHFLRELKETFGCPIYYKIGNHEERWQNFLMINAPEMLGIDDFELSNLLRFGELGVVEIKGRQKAYAGKLALLHGHEFGHSVFSPVNPARGLYLRAKNSSIIGHHHQSSEHSEKSLNGDVVTCWSVGSLCGLSPEYFPINKWNHGFAHITTDKDGSFEVDNLRIIDGKIR
jgi:predicted phosphodiesterase